MDAIRFEDFTKVFKTKQGERKAVDGLTLSIKDGELFGLLGTNGAGKTTTIKATTGLIEPTGGKIEVFGYDIVKEAEKAKELINTSTQETSVAMGLSVRENLEFIAMIYGADKNKAKSKATEMMKMFGLEDRSEERASKLSGGLARRLSIAMALITEPKCVLLDEPTLGLDVLSRRELWHIIKGLKGKTTVVLTTHYLEEAEALCDRIAIMNKGKIMAMGSAAELKKKAGKDDFEEAFLVLTGASELI